MLVSFILKKGKSEEKYARYSYKKTWPPTVVCMRYQERSDRLNMDIFPLGGMIEAFPLGVQLILLYFIRISLLTLMNGFNLDAD